jgi:hypothetical protein
MELSIPRCLRVRAAIVDTPPRLPEEEQLRGDEGPMSGRLNDAPPPPPAGYILSPVEQCGDARSPGGYRVPDDCVRRDGGGRFLIPKGVDKEGAATTTLGLAIAKPDATKAKGDKGSS